MFSVKSGKESFVNKETKLDFNLQEFWSWSQSDLLSNSLRGVLAEFIVAKALNIQLTGRVEWDAYDLITDKGLKIEVKSSAYLQSWKQERLSTISFNISSTFGWDANTNIISKEHKRQADMYVFCLLHHQDRTTVNPMNMDQWTFYILETKVLNEKCGAQKTIGLNSLLKLKPRLCTFNNLKETL